MEITLSQAIDGFLLAKEVEGLSPYTIRNYTLTLRRLRAHFDADPSLSTITTDQVRAFLHQLQTTQLNPAGVAPRPPRTPGPKTILNIHTALSSLWTWAIAEGYAHDHVVRHITPPAPEPPVIEPLSRDEVAALLKATDYTAPWTTRPDIRSARPPQLALRDKALIRFLLDTGVRAAELCDLHINDLDLRAGTALVAGKGHRSQGQGKQRLVYFGKATAKTLWQYLTTRNQDDPHAPLFTTQDDHPLDRRHLAHHLKRLGKKVGIDNIYPHRFRHTFAITYLRNGGDIYTLQQILGHNSLEMVKRYLKIAQTDCQTAHRRASPVDNWRL